MKQFGLCCLLLLCLNLARAQGFFSYSVSKPYCLLNFMNTATGRPGTSGTLKSYIGEHLGADPVFDSLCKAYAKLELHYPISREEFPQGRMQYGSTYNLLARNAVVAQNLEDFKIRSFGLLPLGKNQELFAILSKAEPFYDQIIWNPYREKLNLQLQALTQFNGFNANTFALFAAFYRSSWTTADPIQVALYPIPGKTGHTSATPHINTLCVGMLTADTDYESSNGVVLHEVCHMLFNEQPAAVQQEIENYFNSHPSPYAKLAYTFFDESMATALGNGWAYKKATGQTDQNSWYNNPVIDGFAKALYPIVAQYLDDQKTMDKECINQAVSAFAREFPQALYEYPIHMGSLVLYTDAPDNSLIRSEMRKYFRISGFDASSPVLHPYSLESMEQSRRTQFFVIDRDYNKTIAKLKEIFPELNTYKYTGTSQNLTFTDSKGRVVIILVLKQLSDLTVALQKMADKKYFNPKSLIQS